MRQSVERREKQHVCCFENMRTVTVRPGVLTVRICDYCRTQRWWALDEEVSADLAYRLARELDGYRV